MASDGGDGQQVSGQQVEKEGCRQCCVEFLFIPIFLMLFAILPVGFIHGVFSALFLSKLTLYIISLT